MDWDLAIKRNSEALRDIIDVLFAMLGLVGDRLAARIPHTVHRAVLRILRPAESAVRRLVVIAARGLVVKAAPSRPMPAGPIMGRCGGSRRPSFPLFDPRKSFAELRRHGSGPARIVPRIHFFGNDPRVAALWPTPRPAAELPLPLDGLVNAARLARRLQALKFALDDLPRQARRLARWRLKQENVPGPEFRSPLRPGYPPGHRKRRIHEVDEVLANCHWLAWEAMKPDTS